MTGYIDRASEVASELASSDFVRCISHKDADGITSAGVICTALYREGVPFHTSIVSRPSKELAEEINEEEGETVVFFDMGSGQPDVIKEIDHKVLVVDHHPPEYRDEIADIHLNPHHYGVDGSSEVSAAGLSYLVAREMDQENKDLSRISLAGAIGDRQHLPLKGINKEMVYDGVDYGAIEIEEGIRLYGDLVEAISQSTDPYFERLDSPEKIRGVLNRVEIPHNTSINSLDDRNKEKLIQLLSLMLLGQGATAKTIKDMVGEIYQIDPGPVDYAADLTQLINACARKDKYGMALSLAMGDDYYSDKAREYNRHFNKKILNELEGIRNKIKEKNCIRYLELDNRAIKGVIASITVNCLLPDKPILSLYRDNENGEIKVSARANEKLLEKQVNLSKAMSDGAEKTGGRGGGHDIASGASIPEKNEELFIETVENVVCSQLGVEDEE